MMHGPVDWTSGPVLALGGAILVGASLAWQIHRRRRILMIFQSLAHEYGGRVETAALIYLPTLVIEHDGTSFELVILAGGGQTGYPGQTLFCSFSCPAWSQHCFRLESRTVDTEMRKFVGTDTVKTGNIEFDRRFWLQASDTAAIQAVRDGEIQHNFLAFRATSGVEVKDGTCTLFLVDSVGDGIRARQLLSLSTAIYDRLKGQFGAPQSQTS